MAHILFITFATVGSLAFVASVLSNIKEKDLFYGMISLAPLSMAFGSIYWYGLYLGTW